MLIAWSSFTLSLSFSLYLSRFFITLCRSSKLSAIIYVFFLLFSKCAQHVLIVMLGRFVWWELSSPTAADLKGSVSKIFPDSMQHFFVVPFVHVFRSSLGKNPYSSTNTNTAWKKSRFLLVILFGLFLWHINLCRLFNAKSILIQINSYISNNSSQHKDPV